MNFIIPQFHNFKHFAKIRNHLEHIEKLILYLLYPGTWQEISCHTMLNWYNRKLLQHWSLVHKFKSIDRIL